MTKIRAVQYGCGPIGCGVVKLAAQQSNIEFVGAIDTAARLNGKDLGKTAGLKKKLDILISPDAKHVLCQLKPDLVFLSTVSSARLIRPQVEHCLQVGANVISTCEELCYPYDTMPALASELDSLAKLHNCTLLATGVNPGFLMDYLPCVLSSVCQKVNKIKITRFLDASNRRIPFQQKIGAGLTRTQFKEKVAEGTLRHVGLVESIHLIAHSMNWELNNVTESLKPIFARQTITSGYIKINKGMACGVEQIGRGFIDKKEVIQLRFRAAVGEKESFDTIEITGIPTIRSSIPGGINGDTATCAITINVIRSIVKATPGLKTMLDIPVPGYFQGDSD